MGQEGVPKPPKSQSGFEFNHKELGLRMKGPTCHHDVRRCLLGARSCTLGKRHTTIKNLSVALCRVLCLFPFADDMKSVERDPDAHAVECMAVRMALATAAPHSSQSVKCLYSDRVCGTSSSDPTRGTVIILCSTSISIFDAAPIPVAGHVAPAPADSYATPTTVNAYLASHTWRLHL